MKKVLLISAMAILTIATTKAQEVRFGVKGGLNLANMYLAGKEGSTTIEVDTKYKPSFHIGGFAEYELSDSLYGELGIQYTNNGFSMSEGGKSGTLTLNQINLPLSLKYAVAEGFRVKGGFYVGYIMSVSASAEGRTVTSDEGEVKEKTDYGLSLGAEYVLESGLFFDVNYNYGLRNFADKIEGATFKNRVFQVGVGYKF